MSLLPNKKPTLMAHMCLMFLFSTRDWRLRRQLGHQLCRSQTHTAGASYTARRNSTALRCAENCTANGRAHLQRRAEASAHLQNIKPCNRDKLDKLPWLLQLPWLSYDCRSWWGRFCEHCESGTMSRSHSEQMTRGREEHITMQLFRGLQVSLCRKKMYIYCFKYIVIIYIYIVYNIV